MIARTLPVLLIGLALFVGWKSLSRAAHETVLLHTQVVGNQERFATLWVIDDGSFLWIRAENRTRHWLASVRADPNVELRRRGYTNRYRATFFDTAEARAYVDTRFRAKYGFADWIRELSGPRDTLPIRLELRRRSRSAKRRPAPS